VGVADHCVSKLLRKIGPSPVATGNPIIPMITATQRIVMGDSRQTELRMSGAAQQRFKFIEAKKIHRASS